MRQTEGAGQPYLNGVLVDAISRPYPAICDIMQRHPITNGLIQRASLCNDVTVLSDNVLAVATRRAGFQRTRDKGHDLDCNA